MITVNYDEFSQVDFKYAFEINKNFEIDKQVIDDLTIITINDFFADPNAVVEALKKFPVQNKDRFFEELLNDRLLLFFVRDLVRHLPKDRQVVLQLDLRVNFIVLVLPAAVLLELVEDGRSRPVRVLQKLQQLAEAINAGSLGGNGNKVDAKDLEDLLSKSEGSGR